MANDFRQFLERLINHANWTSVISILIAAPTLLIFGYIVGSRIPMMMISTNLLWSVVFFEFGSILALWVLCRFMVVMFTEVFLTLWLSCARARISRKFPEQTLTGTKTRLSALKRSTNKHNAMYLRIGEGIGVQFMTVVVVLGLSWYMFLHFSGVFLIVIVACATLYLGLSDHLRNREFITSSDGLAALIRRAEQSRRNIAAIKQKQAEAEASLTEDESQEVQGELTTLAKDLDEIEQLIINPRSKNTKQLSRLNRLKRSVSDSLNLMKHSYVRKVAFSSGVAVIIFTYGTERGAIFAHSRMWNITTTEGEFCGSVIASNELGIVISTGEKDRIFFPIARVLSIRTNGRECSDFQNRS